MAACSQEETDRLHREDGLLKQSRRDTQPCVVVPLDPYTSLHEQFVFNEVHFGSVSDLEDVVEVEDAGPKDVPMAHIERFVATLVSMLSGDEFSKGVRVDSVIDMIGDIPGALTGSLDAMHLPIPVSDTTSHRYTSLREDVVGKLTPGREHRTGASRRQRAYVVCHEDRVYDVEQSVAPAPSTNVRAPSILSGSAVDDLIAECRSIMTDGGRIRPITSNESNPRSRSELSEDFEYVIEPETVPRRGRNRVRTTP